MLIISENIEKKPGHKYPFFLRKNTKTKTFRFRDLFEMQTSNTELVTHCQCEVPSKKGSLNSRGKFYVSRKWDRAGVGGRECPPPIHPLKCFPPFHSTLGTIYGGGDIYPPSPFGAPDPEGSCMRGLYKFGFMNLGPRKFRGHFPNVNQPPP